ncbi:MAG: sigma 54-interacting transcriptional regulator [Syntrophales bacterium]|nr:sigma 54-interacting transcriptional regulator [Syntrophales bacterium]
MDREDPGLFADRASSEKRLEFEQFLADLSASFVTLSPAQVDDEIRGALKKVLQFFEIDRCSLLRLLPCRTQWQVSHNADAAGDSPYPVETSLPVSLVPWAAGKLADERETFSFATLDDLPPEAAVDKQTLEMWKVRSGLYIPIAALRSSEYSLGISSGKTGRTCPEEYIPRLRLLGELFVNALERSKGETLLRERLEFEKFTADLSGRFVALPPERVDDEIRNALKEILEFFRIDRCNLLRFLPGESLFQVVHSADVSGVSPYPVGTPRPASLYPWLVKMLSEQHGVVSFAKLEDLPAEAATDRQNLEKVGIRSGLYIHIAALRSSDYSLGITSAGNDRMCPEEYIPRLRLLGELFVHTLERSTGEQLLRERLEEIERLKLQLEKENVYLREEIRTGQGFRDIVGNSDALQYVSFRVRQVAPTDATVLILGETGTGKGMAAHAIHELSARKDRPMITVNCAALPANLIESELFGREKGAFTGAHARQVGRFEVANGGTIFLDEIGEMPLELQAKLLRVLQEGEFERLGSPRTIKVDVRVIASTARDLKAEIRSSRFREDLFYRLNVFPISMPPLRMRRDDIPELVRHFIDKYARKIGRQIKTIPKTVMQSLQDYSWPGNVRELEHVIERAVITSPGPVLQLADRLEGEAVHAKEGPPEDLAAMEREHILRVLQKTRWKINGPGGAAALLNIHPSTLRFRIKKLGIERP